MIIDTHAHYDDKAFNDDRHKALTSLYEKGVEKVINAAASMRGCKRTLDCAKNMTLFTACWVFIPMM